MTITLSIEHLDALLELAQETVTARHRLFGTAGKVSESYRELDATKLVEYVEGLMVDECMRDAIERAKKEKAA